MTCLDCHQAAKGDADGFMHEGALIATLVTPKDCGKCHEKEAQQVNDSYHAHAGEILESNDAYLAHAAGGAPVAIAGCESCHGSKVKIDPNSPNKLHRLSWPNSGIGRINPDGSKGACTACHTRHAFSVKQARQPEACSKCHLGPDHPQKEVYEESKHGNAYYTTPGRDEPGRRPLGRGRGLLRGPHLRHLPHVRHPQAGDHPRRGPAHQLDPASAGVQDQGRLGDQAGQHEGRLPQLPRRSLRGRPLRPVRRRGQPLQREVRQARRWPCTRWPRRRSWAKATANFSNKYEWIWWEIWHHEGRRARHGAAMMGPDYTWWHGIYEVAQHFYFKYIPELRKFHDPELDAMIDEVLADPYHNWLNRPTADIKADIKSGKMAADVQGHVPGRHQVRG